MACWTLAALIWGVYPLLLHRDVASVSGGRRRPPAGDPARARRAAGAPAIDATGGADPLGRRRGGARALLDALVLATALLFVSWTLVLGPVWRATDLASLSGVIGLAYPSATS